MVQWSKVEMDYSYRKQRVKIGGDKIYRVYRIQCLRGNSYTQKVF